MRTFLLTFVLLLPVARVFGQGVINFANNPLSRLTTNDLQGNIGFTSGGNAYRIGFYMAALGTTDTALFTLVPPVAINSSGGVFNGIFNGNGGTNFQIPGNLGQFIAFQVRAWSLFAGNTAEEAQLYNGPETVYYGHSAIGFVTPNISPVGPASPLFGTPAGEVGGFTLTPIIPEPSTVALAVVGAGVLWFATRRRRK